MRFLSFKYCFYFFVILFSSDVFVLAQNRTENIEIQYITEKKAFELEMRNEFTRIAKDQTLSGEEMITLKENWFTSQSIRIDKINRLAELLDEIDPVFRDSRKVSLSFGATDVSRLHALGMRMQRDEITLEEFNRLRAPLIDSIMNSCQEGVKNPKTPLPRPDLSISLGLDSIEMEVAYALRKQNRYLASLSERDADEIRMLQEPETSRLINLLQTKQLSYKTNEIQKNETN